MTGGDSNGLPNEPYSLHECSRSEAADTQATTGKERHAVQYPLRLPHSLKAAAKVMADRDSVSLNQFISLAVAEKVERLEQEMAMMPWTRRA